VIAGSTLRKVETLRAVREWILTVEVNVEVSGSGSAGGRSDEQAHTHEWRSERSGERITVLCEQQLRGLSLTTGFRFDIQS